MDYSNTSSQRCDDEAETEFTSAGPIALDTLVSIIAKNFSPEDMQDLAEKIRVEGVRRVGKTA